MLSFVLFQNMNLVVVHVFYMSIDIIFLVGNTQRNSLDAKIWHQVTYNFCFMIVSLHFRERERERGGLMANLLFPANLKTYFLDKQGSSLLFPNTLRSKRKNQSFIPVIISTISLSNVTFWQPPFLIFSFSSFVVFIFTTNSMKIFCHCYVVSWSSIHVNFFLRSDSFSFQMI